MTINYLDPTLYGPGKSGPQILWMRWRLALHGVLGAAPRATWAWDDTYDKADYQQWQLKLGYTGTGADGYPGVKSLTAAAKDPVSDADDWEYPVELFGPNWKLTTVEGFKVAERRLVEIKQPDLATYVNSLRCFIGPTGRSVIFRSYHGDPTTTGSRNPRSELREMVNNGLNQASWDGRLGTHQCTAEMAVNRLTHVKPDTVLMQIHNGTSDVTTLRCEGIEDDPGYAELWISKGNTSHAKRVAERYKLGTRFRFTMMTYNGSVIFYYNGTLVSGFSVPVGEKNYFKVPCYLQSHDGTAPGESVLEYTEVELFLLEVVHR